MKPFFLSQRPILPPGAAFEPETAVFRLETAPPFGAGAALVAAGAEFRPTGAALVAAGAEFRPTGAALDVAGAEFRRTGASLAVVGVEFRRPGASLDGAGAEFRQPGAAPISCTEAPAAWSDATLSRNGHPAPRSGASFQGSAETLLRIGNPAGKSASAPLCPQPFALCFT